MAESRTFIAHLDATRHPQIVSRHPAFESCQAVQGAEERAIYTELLTPGFENRKTGVKDVPEPKVFRSPLTWTAHFDPDASLEGIRQTEQVEQGDAPTERLTKQWREQFEDATWVLFNSPEFVFVP